MRRVDHMIKYLSGDLNREESKAFEQELSENKQLREAFRQVESAYNLMGTQLRKRDEEAFRTKLREIMEQTTPGLPSVKRQRSAWYLLLPIAASLTLLIVLFVMNRGTGKAYSDFYNPGEDPVILSYCQETRSISDSVITLFSQGYYKASLKKTSEILLQDSDNHLALLFHLLAALELDEEEEAISMVEAAEINARHVLGQSITWYQALALVKTGRRDEAATMLNALTELPGPYAPDAYKLQKILLK